jgi:glycerol-3-phosphate dehydrogenase
MGTEAMTGDERFDLIVVGAGINGAGIARDATMRGLKTLLLDKQDIAAGTTAWSTRLIHGGLRYLEHGEVGLVRESLRERERLLRIAPHLVTPLPLLIPIFAGDRRGPLLIRAGMTAYDALSFDKTLPGHRMLNRNEALARAPGLNPDGLRGAALYYDAQATYVERLAVENAVDAQEKGCVVRLGARVIGPIVEGGRVAGVEAEIADAGESFAARAEAVVNVGGPWVDAVLGGPKPRLIGGTKGSHIVVAPFPGAPADALYVEARRDGRPYFVVPWNDQYLIGTTDSRYDGDLDWVVADDDEIAYLLAETNRVLPGASLDAADVLSSYAGVRPLPYRENGAAGAITRRHLVRDHAAHGGPAGLLSIVGGKLTTYRELAEQATDEVFRLLRRPAPPCRTADEPLPGARGSPSAALPDDLAPASADHLRRVYGSRAADVVALAARDRSLLEPFDPDSGAIGAEIVWAVERERARALADILLRRTMVGLGPSVGVGPDQAAAAVARRSFGWDAARADAEVAAYRHAIARYRPRSLEIAESTAVQSNAAS